MIADKQALIDGLLLVAVTFHTRLAEEDVAVYATAIDRALDDHQWAHALHYYTSAWRDEAPKYMPSPQEIIGIGRLAPPPGVPYIRGSAVPLSRWFEEIDKRASLSGVPPPPALLEAINNPGAAVRAMPRALARVARHVNPPSEEEWADRVRILKEQADAEAKHSEDGDGAG